MFATDDLDNAVSEYISNTENVRAKELELETAKLNLKIAKEAQAKSLSKSKTYTIEMWDSITWLKLWRAG